MAFTAMEPLNSQSPGVQIRRTPLLRLQGFAGGSPAPRYPLAPSVWDAVICSWHIAVLCCCVTLAGLAI